MSSRAPIGYLAVAEVPVAVNQGFVAMLPLEKISNLFLLCWCKESQVEIKNYANGSTFLEISKRNFRQISLVKPVGPVMETFDRLARSLYATVVANAKESRTLTVLRSTLLPKLISGDLRVTPPIK